MSGLISLTLRKNRVYISCPFFSIGHGDKDAVDMVKGEGSYHTKRYDKDVSRTDVRLEFPQVVKFQTDSCLEWGGMWILS